MFQLHSMNPYFSPPRPAPQHTKPSTDHKAIGGTLALSAQRFRREPTQIQNFLSGVFSLFLYVYFLSNFSVQQLNS